MALPTAMRDRERERTEMLAHADPGRHRGGRARRAGKRTNPDSPRWQAGRLVWWVRGRGGHLQLSEAQSSPEGAMGS
jgi:hypothetical protein